MKEKVSQITGSTLAEELSGEVLEIALYINVRYSNVKN